MRIQKERKKHFALQRTKIWSSRIQDFIFEVPLVFSKVLHYFIFAGN